MLKIKYTNKYLLDNQNLNNEIDRRINYFPEFDILFFSGCIFYKGRKIKSNVRQVFTKLFNFYLKNRDIFFITDEGRLFTYSKKQNNQLDIFLDITPQDQKIIKVGFCDENIVLLTEQGNVFISEYSERQVYATTHTMPVQNQKIENKFIKINDSNAQQFSIIFFSNSNYFAYKRYNNFFLNSLNQLYMLQNNSLKLLNFYCQEKVKRIKQSRFGNIVLLLTAAGRVFKNEGYNLSKFIEVTPKNTKITRIVVSSHVAFLLNAEGEVFGFGCNVHGQLGKGEQEKNIKQFENITPTGFKIKNIKAAHYNTFFITEKNNLLVSGKNEFGVLGVGNNHKQYKFIETNLHSIKIKQFLRLESEPGYILRNIIIVTDDGSIFGCGNNEYGQLNINNKNNLVSFVELTPVGEKVIRAIKIESLMQDKIPAVCFITVSGKVFMPTFIGCEPGSNKMDNQESFINIAPSGEKIIHVAYGYYKNSVGTDCHCLGLITDKKERWVFLYATKEMVRLDNDREFYKAVQNDDLRVEPSVKRPNFF